ncbi:hypothetical protein CRG98_001977 [Punica granatum]|uniref:Uncharacterized protein n=1 Tax=Punica granatum TaxID=22663 RepID=A0A2I0LAC4_PUNGR|nr:hypothetical protein CRG98_001977 [Punica granatum]
MGGHARGTLNSARAQGIGLAWQASCEHAEGVQTDLPLHSEFERARHWKAPVLGEGLAETSILECMHGPMRALLLDLSYSALGLRTLSVRGGVRPRDRWFRASDPVIDVTYGFEFEPQQISKDNNANYRIYGKMTEIPKADETGHANKTRTRTGCPSPTINRGVSISLTPRMSTNHETTVMPLGLRNV